MPNPQIKQVDLGGTTYDITVEDETVARTNVSNYFTRNQFVKGKYANLRSTDIAAGETGSTKTGNAYLDFSGSDNIQVGRIKAELQTDGKVNLNINAFDGKVLINGHDIEAIETALAGKQDKLTNPLTKSDVINNLTTTTTNVPLSAAQGKKLFDNSGVYKLLGSANTPTTPNTAVTITLNESANNFAFVYILYIYGWGASHPIVYPTRVPLSVPFIPECGGANSHIRIDGGATSIKVTTGTYDYGNSSATTPDKISVYGIIRIN